MRSSRRGNPALRLDLVATGPTGLIGLTALTALSALCSGCTDTNRFELSPPASVTHIGAIETNGGGVVGGTALIPWSPSAPLQLAALEPSVAFLYGFDQTTLAALGGDPASLESSVLEVVDAANTCAPTLPDAEWRARWNADGTLDELDDATALPAISSAWLDDACESVDDDALRFDLRGASSECEVDPLFERLDRCRRRVTLCRATPNPIHLVLGDALEPALCAESPPDAAAACVRATPEPRAIGATECPEVGTFDIIDVSDPPDLGIEHTAWQVTDVPPPEDGESARTLGRAVFDALPRADRVLVSRASARARGCSTTAQAELRELAAFDANTSELIATATVPPCFSRMVHAPDGDGLFATFFRAGSFRVGRFDDSGRERESVSIPFPGPIDLNVDARGLEALPDATLGVLVSRQMIRNDGEVVSVFSRFVRLDAATLSVQGDLRDFEHPVANPDMLEASAVEFLLSAGWSQTLYRIAADGTEREEQFEASASDALRFHPLRGPFALQDGTVGVTARLAPVRFVTTDEERWEEGHVAERSSVSSGVEWPAKGPGIVLFVARHPDGSYPLLIDSTTRRASIRAGPFFTAFEPELQVGPDGRAWGLDGLLGTLHRFASN